MRKTMENNFNAIKNSSLTAKAVDTFNQSSILAKAASIATLSAVVATATQSKQCSNEWTGNFFTSLSLCAAVCVAPVVYNRFFAEQKKPVVPTKQPEQDMTPVAPP